ncbi:MAG: amino acid permease [Acidobacteria bacterium]|nr:amino acid permease [Acidobacteriota bacterium]
MSTLRSLTANRSLVRGIGRWSLAALTVNSVIGSGIFGLPAIVAGLLGDLSPWAVIMGAFAMGAIMACFAEVASQFSDAGGPYLYARHAFGRLMGILVGWFFYLAMSAAAAANLNLFVIYLAEFWTGAKGVGARFLVVTVLIGFLTVVNLLGVRPAISANNVFTIAKTLALLFVVVAGLAAMLLSPATVPHPVRHIVGTSWLQATVLLAFLFGGFETALAPMSEAKNPRVDSVFALFAALIACAAIYTMIQWVVIAILGPNATTDRPLAEVARLTTGRGGAACVAVGAMLSVYGFLGAKLLAVPRVTYALAEHDELPPIFAAVSSRFHSPWVSIVFYASLVWLLAIIGSFAWNVTLSVIARLFYYAVVCSAVISLRSTQTTRAGFRLPGGPLLPILAIGVCIVLGTQVDFRQGKILGFTVLAALVHWQWTTRLRPLDGKARKQ